MTALFSDRRKRPRPDDPERRGRRSEPRAPLFLAGYTEALSGHCPVTLLEVSQNGARLQGSGLPEVGKEVVLRSGDFDTFGTITWTESRVCGMQFDEPISLRELVNLRDKATAAQRSRRAPNDHQAAEEWANGLGR
jgi:hypothetical protein